MITKIIEATNYTGEQGTGINHGKFMILQFDIVDWAYASKVSPSFSLLSSCGWGPGHYWVMDLQTGEGALFSHGGLARADLAKHRIWVCPLFEPFLEWFYEQDIKGGIDKLPEKVVLKDAESALYGYRRAGPRPTVHVLRGGQALCGLSETPNKWPEGDRWVESLEEMKKAQETLEKTAEPCAKCVEYITKR